MKEIHEILNEGEVLHHINWDNNDYDENNLIAIPKPIKDLIHEYLGYVDREEINLLVDKFNSTKNLRNKPIGLLNLKLSNLVNTNKMCSLSLNCKDKIGPLPIQKEKVIKNVNYRKLYESIHGKINQGWDIHHIDWSRENNDIDNLIAIPKKIHFLTHKYWGYIDRNEYEQLLVEFPKYPPTSSLTYLNLRLSKFINKRKTTELARTCKLNMEVSILRYRDSFNWRDGKSGMS